MRILLIDDDDVTRELLSSTLKRHSHEVYELATAIGAPRVISEHAIQVAVIDVNLPDMNGDKLSRVLRDGPRGPGLGIVLVSSLTAQELARLRLLAQADAVLSKADIRKGLELAVTEAYQRRSRTALSSQ